MVGFFSKNKSKQTENKKSLIRYEKNEHGEICIFFNELKAKKIKGEYIYDSTGATRSMVQPQDINTKFKKYTIFEWAIEDKDYINKGDTLFVIRRDENDFVKEVQNEVLILPQIVSLENGIVDIKKQEKDRIVNDDLICKIYPDDIFANSNNPENEIYFGKFDKYEIPKQIRDSNYITGKFIFLTKWLVKMVI